MPLFIAGKTQWQNGVWLRKLAAPANQVGFSPFAAFCSRRNYRMMPVKGAKRRARMWNDPCK
jgi:hypothetical protein